MNIFLIGYRCTGKTTVGKVLSQYIQWPFIDSDQKLVEIQGMLILDIVKTHGWSYFREKEKQLLNQLCQYKHHVIATGGGVILDPDNRQAMKKSGKRVWLRARPETIYQRMQQDIMTRTQRPALNDDGMTDLKMEINQTLSHRMPLYKECADMCIDTDELDSDHLANAIFQWVCSTDFQIKNCKDERL
ncbi:MAG: shikimate kinase [Desulfobacterales bacterium]|nr:shikimate kinase [Desulfobacterales bacterium]